MWGVGVRNMVKNNNKTTSKNTSIDKNNIKENSTKLTKKSKEKILQVAKNIAIEHKYAFEVLAE